MARDGMLTSDESSIRCMDGRISWFDGEFVYPHGGFLVLQDSNIC